MKQILDRSMLHCHTPFVHSIMLLECPEKTIRLFVAEPNHKLNDNSLGRYKAGQSLGFHAHHCELTLVPTRGDLWNWIIAPQPNGAIKLGEYRYQSAITKGKIGFQRLGDANFVSQEYRCVRVGDSKAMVASDIHTVVVEAGEPAAWFALEGRENPNYDNRCWSSTDLEREDFSGLYQRMDEKTLRELLYLAHLL